MREYWIIGVGKFGRRALNLLAEWQPGDRFVAVDNSRTALERIRSSRVEAVCEDGVDFLVRRLVSRDRPDWIVPCLPLHLAFEWVRRRLENTHALERLPVSDSVRQALPHPFEGRGGALYLSYAESICPDDCPEPADICTVTGRPRPGTLYKTVAALPDREIRSVVVRSRQLLPGVGGYRPRTLFEARDQVRASSGIIALATACRCHGVLHMFRFSRNI